MILSKATLLDKSALKRKDIEVPDVGTISIRQLSAAEVEELAKFEKANKDKGLDHLAWIFIRTVCTETGEAMFVKEDTDRIKQMPLALLKAVTEEAVKFSGIDVDGSEKNGGNTN